MPTGRRLVFPIPKPSVGTPSPADKITVSPTTTSETGISITLPSRRTRQKVDSERRCSLSKARSLPRSDNAETSVAIMTAHAMPAVSYQSTSPNETKIFGNEGSDEYSYYRIGKNLVNTAKETRGASPALSRLNRILPLRVQLQHLLNRASAARLRIAGSNRRCVGSQHRG